MNPMRIALIHPRLIRRGGLETRLLNYMEWFSKQGCEVNVYCFKRDDSIDLPKNVSVHQFNLSWVPKLFRARYFSHLLANENVKSNHDFTLSLGRTSHQDAVLGPGNHIGYLRAFGRSAISPSDLEQIAMDKKAYSNSDVIFAASQFMADEIVELFGIQKEKVHVLHPPYNSKTFSDSVLKPKSIARQELGIPRQGKVICMLSSGHNMKGMPMMFDVMKVLPEVKLLVAGSPVTNAPSNVKYLGFLKNPKVVFEAADALVLPSVYEAFGQVVVEALACGTPVLVSENVGAKEVIPKGSGQILPVGDKAAWINAIQELQEKQETPEALIDTKNLDLDTHMHTMCEAVGLKL
jgi:glycosyltransferase involved in cell wall biosynthesis